MSTEILLLEDSALDAELIGEHLRKGGILHRMDRTATREDFVRALERRGYDLILADYSLPSFDGMAALDIAREETAAPPFIFVSGTLGEEIAIESLKKGATDYVVKQRLARLPSAVTRALAEAKEREERRRAEQRQTLLLQELNHRVKNTLATVQSIANQTLRSTKSPEAFRDAFLARLKALSATHDLLTQGHWEGAALQDVLASELSPYQDRSGPRYTLEGPSLRLSPNAAITLALAFHELATNAAKYGALASAEGRLDVRWRLVSNGKGPVLRLEWRETGGPPVEKPSRRGFGSRLIEGSVAHDLGGTALLDYAPGGLCCDIEVPLGAAAVPD